MQKQLTNQITFRRDLTTHGHLGSPLPLGALQPSQLFWKEAGSLHRVSCSYSKCYLLGNCRCRDQEAHASAIDQRSHTQKHTSNLSGRGAAPPHPPHRGFQSDRKG